MQNINHFQKTGIKWHTSGKASGWQNLVVEKRSFFSFSVKLVFLFFFFLVQSKLSLKE